jgi:hypothetical protein
LLLKHDNDWKPHMRHMQMPEEYAHEYVRPQPIR